MDRYDSSRAVDYKQLVDGRSLSFLAFQCTSAAMLGGALLSIGVVSLSSNHPTLQYAAALSIAICGVAYVHYSAMTKQRLETVKACRKEGTLCDKKLAEDDFIVTCMRYSDWLITMPLIALKLLALAEEGNGVLDNDSILSAHYIQALIAALSHIMILCGLAALLSVGDFESICDDNKPIGLMRWGIYLLGVVCLVVVYLILFNTAESKESPYSPEVYGFALVWILYPIVFLMQMFGLACGVRKDILFCVLDVISKPLLAVFTARATLVHMRAG